MRKSLRCLLVPLVIALAVVGCMGKRRPHERGGADQSGPGPVLGPDDVDDRLSELVTGDRQQVLYSAKDPYKGAANPLVTIVEYSDFQCPFCSRLAGSLEEILAEEGDVRIVFKHYPMDMHKNAPAAAAASLAAHEQGKFWPMHDKLFVDQRALKPSDIERYAKALGLDVEKFDERQKAADIKARVRADQDAGNALGVNSTPTFFVNGRKVTGAKPTAAIQAIIAEERQLALQLVEAGSKREEIYARIMKVATPPAGAAKPEPEPEPPKKAEPPKKPEPPAKKEEEAKPEPEPEAPKIEIKPDASYGVPLGEGRPRRGPDDALVTVVEFAPLTGEVARENKAVLDKVAKKQKGVAFVFRHFPGADPGAKRAARAALAAQQQGKFWEMRDALFKADAKLDGPVLLETAKSIGLDEAKFRGDLQATRLGELVDEDVAIANAVRGETDGPIYFVNGRFLAGKITAEQLTALINEEKKKAKAWMKEAGVKKSPDLYATMAKTWLNHEEILAAMPKG